MVEAFAIDRARDFRRGSIQFTLTTGGFSAAQESGARRGKDIVLWGNTAKLQSRAEASTCERNSPVALSDSA
jgi:hypothetical protein